MAAPDVTQLWATRVASLGASPAWSTVFPNAVIPAPCQDPVAANLLQEFVPAANVGGNQNVSVPVSSDNEDQFTVRIDHRINSHQNFSAYYYFNDVRQFQPYDQFEAAGATVPGFGNFNNSRFQQWNLSHTWTISNAVVNEARFTYMREGQLGFLKPQTTDAVTASCTGAAAYVLFHTAHRILRPINALLTSFWHPCREGRNHSRLAREPHRSSLRQYRWRRCVWQQLRGCASAGRQQLPVVGQLDLGERQPHFQVWRRYPPRPF